MNKKTKNRIRELVPYFTLLVYLMTLIWRMFFFAYDGFIRFQSKSMAYNLIPFKTISDFIKGYHNYEPHIIVYNLLGNVIIFMPLGFLLPFVLKKNNNLEYVFIISFFTILLAESMQLIFRVGVFDVDDLILNLIGCLIGYFLSKFMRTGDNY